LGNQTQFSWGVVGLKEETAKKIELNLKDPTSPFYPGAAYAHLLDFQTANPDEERFNRIANDKNHYYAYLYAALYLKEVIAEWRQAGYDISNRPEILATLYNIGFTHSQPKSRPSTGGAEIKINGVKYTFGGLAYEFYYSSKLNNLFP